MSRRRIVALVVVAALMAAPATAATNLSQQVGNFRVTGPARGLYPGGAVPMVLTVTNLSAFPIVVTGIAARVDNASSRCPAKWLTVAPFVGSKRTPALGQGSVTVTAKMSPKAPQGCVGVTFPIQYVGVGVRG